MMKLSHDDWDFEIEHDHLDVRSGGVQAASLAMAPLLEGRASSLKPWRQLAADHLTAELAGGEGSVHLAIEHGHVCYWMQSTREEFRTLTYFPASDPTGTAWQSYLSDEHDKLWENDVDTTVQVSSSYVGRHPDGEDGQGMLDPGDNPPTWIWNIPVRACSLRTDAGWLGVSVPGPLPVGVTGFSMRQRRFSLVFEALCPACVEGQMPRVYVVTGLHGAYDVLDAHREISDRMGLIRKKSAQHPAWWSQPVYKYWDELCRRHKEKYGEFVALPLDQDGNEVTELTTENLLSWTNTVSESIRLTVNIPLEQGTFLRYGDYMPTNSLGGVRGLRTTIDQLRERGTHTLLFFHLYHVDTGCAVYEEHPEYFCKPRPDAPNLKQGCPARPNERLAYIDWTHPGARDYMLGLVEFLLSEKSGCLNADYLGVNNNIGVDPRYFEFHDRNWGIGDLMQYKVQRLVYEKAHEVKPDCLVRRQSAADCYMQPYADNLNCCEHWFSHCDEWYRRAQIVTRLMPDVLFSADAWFVTLTKLSEYYMALMVWNVPETEALGHAIHPYLHYRPLQEKHFRRRRSGLQVYNNAPCNITDQCRVTWKPDGSIHAWRKGSTGPLQGFYKALALGRKAFVTYSEGQALIGCSESRIVEVPLPRGAVVSAVEMVPHEGPAKPWEHEAIQTRDGTVMRTHVIDCGYEAMFYRIRYRLT
jgi:hypothetical protein